MSCLGFGAEAGAGEGGQIRHGDGGKKRHGEEALERGPGVAGAEKDGVEGGAHGRSEAAGRGGEIDRVHRKAGGHFEQHGAKAGHVGIQPSTGLVLNQA